MRKLVLLSLVAALAACASGAPDIPIASDQRTAEDGPLDQVRDWDDWGPDENRRAREQGIAGNRLDTAEIRALLMGRVLRGCYPNGQRFAEALNNNGVFYDANDNNRELGTYTIEKDQLCFRYPERARQGAPDSCFVVFKRGQDLDFYSPDLRAKAASTDCS